MIKIDKYRPEVIYQDDSILVLDKPSGWITNEASTTTTQPVVQSWLKENFKYPISDLSDLRSGIVHRLDKETSGILIVAKTKDTFENLQTQFKERKVRKTYIALLHGNLKPAEGKIETEVGRLPWRRDRFGIVPGGRVSLTEYIVLENYESPESKPHLKSYSFVEFHPKTGRTHQIRIHCKFIGHPIVGDEFYAGRKTARDDRKWCPRLFLHASKLSLMHPITNEQVEFKSELPKELQKVLGLLEI